MQVPSLTFGARLLSGADARAAPPRYVTRHVAPTVREGTKRHCETVIAKRERNVGGRKVTTVQPVIHVPGDIDIIKDLPTSAMKTAGKYEIREILGEGGMGVVYRAFDPSMGREVTLKTIRNAQDKAAIELFKRECAVLAGLAHPNIVEIFETGETDEPSGNRPYFVMPLLRGSTLDKLIKTSSVRLTTERSIAIMSQICRGLQAAHEQGLVHRDLKPSNLFILDDDSVKIIDFGVAHLMSQQTATGLKGTLLYMAPEQLQMKQPTPFSDQFSIAAVCYEMLANRHPFTVPGYKDLTQAILNHQPAPISDLNHAVNPAISQVVHKALAKEPVHRFSDVREFGDCLQKALRNEPIAIFDSSKLEPRLERARKAFASGDLEFASEIIRELESESYLHPDIQRLHQEIDRTQRRVTVTQLLDTAKRRFEEKEYLLALQRVQEVLNIDPAHTDAFALKAAIETERSSSQIEGSLRLAQQHLENHAYDLARQAAGRVRQLRPKDGRALALLAETDRREQESARVRMEKEKAYQAAMQSVSQGEVSAALSKLERLLELERRSPDSTTPDQSASYQKLYEDVRSKRDRLDAQYAEAKRFFTEGNLAAALGICDEVLKEFPGNVVFQSLKYDIEEASREEISTYIAKVEKEVAAERDLSRKVSILEAAKQKYPSEARFSQSLDRVRSRRDLVLSIVGRATVFEDSGQFSEALGQWEIMRNTYPQYPGLEVEIERLKQRREQQLLTEAKSRWVEQIDAMLGVHDYTRANSLADDALGEFKSDPELFALKKSAQLGLKRCSDASEKIEQGRALQQAGSHPEAFEALREAMKLDPESQPARNTLLEALLQRGRVLLASDWKTAEPLINEAHDLDPGNPLAKSLRTLIEDRIEDEAITEALSKARESQARGETPAAIDELDRALQRYPGRERLLHLRSSLVESLPAAQRSEMRLLDLNQVKQLAEESEKSEDPIELETIFAKTRVLASKYAGDTEFLEPMSVVQTRVRKSAEAATVVLVPAHGSPALLPAGASQGTKSKRGAGEMLPLLYRTMWGRAVLAILAIAAAAVVFTYARPSPKATPLPPPLAALTLHGTTDTAHIVDSSGADFTDKQNALPRGDYFLVDSKPGFHALKMPFHVDPVQNAAPSLEAQWVPLVAKLQIHATPVGRWSLDGQEIPAAELDSIQLPGNGKHELIWSEGGVEARLPFTVTDGYAELEKWSPSAARALAVSVRPDGSADVRLLDLKLRYQAGSGPSQDTETDGPLSWRPGSEQLSLQSSPDDASLGSIGQHDPANGGLIYVSLMPPPPPPPVRTVIRPQPKVVVPAPPPPPPTAATPKEPPKPVLSPEEKKAQRLKELGLPPDIIKKENH